jgi:hypothetical protein
MFAISQVTKLTAHYNVAPRDVGASSPGKPERRIAANIAELPDRTRK